jgi:amicyanin
MKKSTLTLIIVAVLVAGGGAVYALTRPDNDDTNQASESTSDTTTDSQQNSNPVAAEPETPASDGDNQVASDEVEIEDFAFGPATITIKKGTTVRWTNKDSVQHNIEPDTESDAFKRSELLSKDESYSFTFNTAGTYTYHCQPHPQMTGKVIVTE